MAQQTQSEIRYLTPPSVDVKKKKSVSFIIVSLLHLFWRVVRFGENSVKKE